MDSYQLGIGSSSKQPLSLGISHIFFKQQFKKARIEEDGETINSNHEKDLENKIDDKSESNAKESPKNNQSTSPTTTTTTTTQGSEPDDGKGDQEERPCENQGKHGGKHEQESPAKPTTPGVDPPTPPGKGNEVHPPHGIPEKCDHSEQKHDHPESENSNAGKSD
tara:strand:- start:1304 stop:1798 length:495 start_codon:yes stop_codon:yes gene_type:complete